MSRRVDELLAKRVGQFAAAEKCRNRALAFYKQGQVVRAISELHEAKVKWFAMETLRGSILAMLFLVQSYIDLGLFYASKYYAMAVAWLSLRSEKQDIEKYAAEALMQVAFCEYSLGNWRGFLHFADLGVRGHWVYGSASGKVDVDHNLEGLLLRITVVLSVTERIDNGLATAVRDFVSNWGMDEDIDLLIPDARGMWSDQQTPEVLSALGEKLRGWPFNDLANEREAVWQALGISWRVHWSNDYRTNMAAEQLVATLQITLTDFAKHDLHLLKTDVDIEVSVGPVESPEAKPIPSNEGRRWAVVLSDSDSEGSEAVTRQDESLLEVAFQVLHEVSLLPAAQFMSVLEEVVRQGISAKVFIARSFEELLREMIPQESALLGLPIPSALAKQNAFPVPPSHQELDWNDTLAPSYSLSEAEDAIRRRYSRIQAKIPVTLARLKNSEQFANVVNTLRFEGWKDWHILMAVSNIVWNFHLVQRYGPTGPPWESANAMKRSMMDLTNDLQLESTSVVPLEEFTIEKLRRTLDMSMGATLLALGLECHQDTPDIPAIRDFLAIRFNYWNDDIDHVDPFSSFPDGIILIANHES